MSNVTIENKSKRIFQWKFYYFFNEKTTLRIKFTLKYPDPKNYLIFPTLHLPHNQDLVQSNTTINIEHCRFEPTSKNRSIAETDPRETFSPKERGHSVAAISSWRSEFNCTVEQATVTSWKNLKPIYRSCANGCLESFFGRIRRNAYARMQKTRMSCIPRSSLLCAVFEKKSLKFATFARIGRRSVGRIVDRSCDRHVSTDLKNY